MGSMCYGKDGDDMVIKVPVGTQILDEDSDVVIADMKQKGQRFRIAKGGKGGLGNIHFKSSTNRAPRQHTKGTEGDELWVWLKLKLISDAGIIGLPNAGKSTFLAAVSKAKPKIADYPFTTLKPQLGVASVGEKEFVIADIPGLIEGAHEGHGLGDKFLKHIERCGVLLHLIDGTSEDVKAVYKTVRSELKEYDAELAKKAEVVALNKCDSLSDEEIKEKAAALKAASRKKIYTISAVSGDGVKEVLKALHDKVEEFRKESENAE